MIENMADTICPHFPPSQPCGCPLLAGDLDMKGGILTYGKINRTRIGKEIKTLTELEM
jgi:hypothetical protein